MLVGLEEGPGLWAQRAGRRPLFSLAKGSLSSGLEGGAVSPVLVGFAKGAYDSPSPKDAGCNGGEEAINCRGRQEQRGGDFGYVGKGKA